VPLLCPQEADANTIAATTIAIIAIHFAILTFLLSRPFRRPRMRDSALQAQEPSSDLVWIKFDALADEVH
jgi:hypothetical protein